MLHDIKLTLDCLIYSPPVSFGMTPISEEPQRGRIRPQAARGARRNIPKAQRYSLEFERRVDPSTHYRVRFYTHQDAGKVFEIVREQQQGEPVEVVFSCPGTHAYVKPAYLVFGLMEYNIEQFLAYVKDNPIQPTNSLSPDHVDISEYNGQVV
ncbi:hypothetical protein EON65_58945 [archaeon]|nr:MAG: hypothetical protein EON65_58945 [archaeon]